MLMFKACPKCKGDVELRENSDGELIRCLMCGLSRQLPAGYFARRRLEPVRELPRAG